MNSTCQAYNPQTCNLPHLSHPSSGTLPFTGFNAFDVIVLAVILLALGVTIRLAVLRSAD